MVNTKKLVKGEILSETSYFTVKEVKSQSTSVTDSNGNELEIGNSYIEKVLNSADQFDNTIELNQTEVIAKFIESSRVATSVHFRKADKPKTKKAFNAEKVSKREEIMLAPTSKVPALLDNLMDNPILDYIPGEMRTMKGYHEGSIDDRGRVQFKDMEDPKGFMKQVDPRTIQWIIVNNTKYIVK